MQNLGSGPTYLSSGSQAAHLTLRSSDVFIPKKEGFPVPLLTWDLLVDLRERVG
jgi:hypothetical protein